MRRQERLILVLKFKYILAYSKTLPIKTSLARQGFTPEMIASSITNIRQKCHKSRPLNGFGHGVLTCRTTTVFTAADDFALTAGQSFEQFNIFIIDIKRFRTFAVHKERVFSLNADFRFGTLTGKLGTFLKRRSRHVTLC